MKGPDPDRSEYLPWPKASLNTHFLKPLANLLFCFLRIEGGGFSAIALSFGLRQLAFKIGKFSLVCAKFLDALLRAEDVFRRQPLAQEIVLALHLVSGRIEGHTLVS